MRYKRKKNYWQQDISKKEYLIAVLQGTFLIGAVSYMFYGTLWVAILLSPYLIWYLKSWKRQTIRKKQQEFQLQFQEAITAISSGLNVGYSVENAMRESQKELALLYRKDATILREFRYMSNQLEMNMPVEEILNEFASRTRDEEVQNFVTVFAMAKRSGGDMISIIRNAVYQIREKMAVKREIETMMSAKKFEFRIMSVIPFAMIVYLKWSFPDFMKVLYGNLVGVCVMTVCLAVYAGAYELGKRIVEIEV